MPKIKFNYNFETDRREILWWGMHLTLPLIRCCEMKFFSNVRGKKMSNALGRVCVCLSIFSDKRKVRRRRRRNGIPRCRKLCKPPIIDIQHSCHSHHTSHTLNNNSEVVSLHSQCHHRRRRLSRHRHSCSMERFENAIEISISLSRSKVNLLYFGCFEIWMLT